MANPAILSVKNAGVWKAPVGLSVKDAGVWKTPVGAWVKTGGVWEQFWPTTISDPNFDAVVFLSGFNGANGATVAVDEATGKSITFTGNAKLDTSQFKFGVSSLALDGSGDYLTVPDSLDWAFGGFDAPFTIEGWFRFAATPINTLLFGQWPNAWVLWFLSGQLFLRTIGGDGTKYTWSPTLNTWHHIACDRTNTAANNTLRLYVNGVMVAKDAAFTINIPDASSSFMIGSLTPASLSGYDLNGWVDELRITKGVARYASDAGFAVPTAEFPRVAPPLTPTIPSYANPGGKGNRTSSITVTTTATLAGSGGAPVLIDGSRASVMWFNPGQSGREIKFDFGTQKIITESTWYQDIVASQGTWKWQGSNDNSIFTDIGGTFTLGSPSATTVTTTLSGNTTGYRYYKLIQTAGTTSNANYLLEIEFKIAVP